MSSVLTDLTHQPNEPRPPRVAPYVGSPVISIVVPTYQRPALLRRCLQALLKQHFNLERFEIIVADDGPDSLTEEVVRQMAQGATPHPSIRYLAVTGTQGPAGARNRGWREARGEVIAFTDDDTVPDPNWLAHGFKTLRQEAADAVSGFVYVPMPKYPTDYERDASGLQGAEFVTANCFIKRAALEAVGGFDERFTAAWREDSDLYFSLIERGKRVVPAPDAVVRHPVRPAPWGISLKQQRKVLFDALLFKKHPVLYRTKIRPRPRWDYYAIVTTLLIALLAAFSTNWGLALLAFGAWLVMTARFCRQRLAHTSHHPSHVLEIIVTSIAIPPLATFWRLIGAVRFRVLFT